MDIGRDYAWEWTIEMANSEYSRRDDDRSLKISPNGVGPVTFEGDYPFMKIALIRVGVNNEIFEPA